MIVSPTGGSVGLGFAIPAARAERIVLQLKDKGSVTRGWLGMQYQALSSELASTMGLSGTLGIVVSDVQPGGPAGKAGVQVGDLIVAMDGHPLEDAHEFKEVLENTAPGTRVSLAIVRANRGASVEAVVETTPAGSNKSSEVASFQEGIQRKLGLAMASGSEFSGKANGVMVVRIDPGGLAAGRGVDAGDLILDVERRPVTTPDEVLSIIEDASKTGKQSVMVRRSPAITFEFVVVPIR